MIFVKSVMSKLCRIYCLCSVLAVFYVAGPAWAQPVLKFSVKSHDFGRIDENKGPVRFAFHFVNGGDAPLVVEKTEVSCVCTRTEFSRKPVMPGGEGEVAVIYNPKGTSGSFFKAVKVVTNDLAGTYVITVSGVVATD